MDQVSMGCRSTNLRIGMFLEIATPVCRVAVAAIAFAWERDWLYVGVGLLVLVLLWYGLLARHL
jgi:uncharacterized membrane protein